MDKLLIFADTDELGNITASCIGENVVPDRQYIHFIFLANTELTAEEIILDYQIINNTLVKKES